MFLSFVNQNFEEDSMIMIASVRTASNKRTDTYTHARMEGTQLLHENAHVTIYTVMMMMVVMMVAMMVVMMVVVMVGVLAIIHI